MDAPHGLPQLHPMGIGEILDVAIKIYRRHAWTLWRITLVVIAPVTILSNLIVVSATPSGITTDFGGTGGFGAHAGLTQHQVTTLLTGDLAAFALLFVGYLFATGAAFDAVSKAFLGEPANWRRSLAYAARRVHSLAWLTILGAIVTLLGAIACLLPGIYLAVSFTVAVPVLLSEGLRGRRALGRSRRLIKGRWWGTLGLILLGGILTTVANSVFTGLAIGVAAGGAGGDTFVGFTVGSLASIAAKTLTTPFAAAYITVLYFDLRVRKEAFDLQLLALQVGVDPPGAGPGLLDAPPPEPSDRPPFWPPPPGWQPGGPSGGEPGGGAT